VNRILCPNCGTETEDPQGSRSSEGFCPACDFPLFFNRGVAQKVDTDTAAAKSRLPGVAGLGKRAWLPCPDCAELNPRDGVTCLRCGAILVPPEPEPEPEPEPVIIIRETIVDPVRRRVWPYRVQGALIGAVSMVAVWLLAIWIW